MAFSDVVAEAAANASSVNIVTGYFGVDSLVELQSIFQRNPRPRQVNFTLGMAVFDGLTKVQLKALEAFDGFLKENSFGQVYLAVTFPIHSKVMTIVDSDSGRTFSLLGSSNFSSLVSTSRQYETDLLIEGDDDILLEVLDFIDRCKVACEPLSEVADRIPILSPKLTDLSIEQTVTRADAAEASRLRTDITFDIPIKPEPRSHLNIFFGRGRVDSKGRELPRPWYEAEIIVSKQLTTLPHYPTKEENNGEFTVITDDGWSFPCKVNGDFNKNFRSSGNLEILGKWLKGRLEAAGSLQPGQVVSAQTLLDYGRETMSLTRLSHPANTWFLDFSSLGEVRDQ